MLRFLLSLAQISNIFSKHENNVTVAYNIRVHQQILRHDSDAEM